MSPCPGAERPFPLRRPRSTMETKVSRKGQQMAQLTETTSERIHPALGFLKSTLTTARLLARHRLRLPKSRIGARLSFEDGTTSIVYRETVLSGATTHRPTVLVVRFQLRFIGRNPLLHKLFRIESLLNTPLFAGFPGFRTKLWLCDTAIGVYRGVYEWDGARNRVRGDALEASPSRDG